MANISTGAHAGGRKTVDSEIPLVPFIDLLLCCVMFLLVTAVWNQLAAVDASTPNATGDARPVDAPVDTPPVYLELTRTDVGVSFPDGSRSRVALEALPMVLQHLDEALVLEMLPDDDVPHEGVVRALSLLRGAGHPRVRLLYSRPAG